MPDGLGGDGPPGGPAGEAAVGTEGGGVTPYRPHELVPFVAATAGDWRNGTTYLSWGNLTPLISVTYHNGAQNPGPEARGT